MLDYAVRFEVNEIILFYPNTIKQGQEEGTELTIKDALARMVKKYLLRHFSYQSLIVNY